MKLSNGHTIKVGQVYTFNNGETYDIIEEIEPNKIWYQIWQIKDLTYWDKKLNRYIIWSKGFPNHEGTCVELEYMTFEEFRECFDKRGKYLGEMNKDFGLNEHFRLVRINEATRPWRTMKEHEQKYNSKELSNDL